jgi:hypothetical protein
MSNVQFQNAYVEVLLDNFMTVVKQNVYLQAQQKVSEQAVEKANEINIQANNLAEKNISLQSEVQNLKTQLDGMILVQEKADSGELYRKEKDRVQSSLNDFMRKNKILQDEITDIKLTHNTQVNTMSDTLVQQASQIDLLNSYIGKLEQNVSASKLKKIKFDIEIKPEVVMNSDAVEIVETPEEEVEIRNGGSF